MEKAPSQTGPAPTPANDGGTGARVGGGIPPAPANHNALLHAVAHNKDRAAFAALFGYFAPRIKSFLMKGGAAPDQADELAQETMLTVWQKAPSFDPAKAAASTWIFTIARNKRIDALRRKTRPEIDIEEPVQIADETPLISEKISTREEADIMARAIKSLPPEQAELLYKSYFEDKTHAAIAAETAIPLGTVKSRIRLALGKLRGEEILQDLRP